jgi:hypothetical protein
MKSQLRVEARAETGAPAEVVWSMVNDAVQYAKWGPWDESGYESPTAENVHGVGAIRWMRLGHTMTVERILELEPMRRMAYTVVRGIPVRNYRAEVVLDSANGGTAIRWSAAWDDTLLGRVVRRRLAKFYPEMVRQLVTAADRRSAAGKGPG